MLHNLTITADDSDFQSYLEQPRDAARVRPADLFEEELLEAMFEMPRFHGATLPWSKTYEKIRFRPAEVTLWLGINGHGKSLVSSQAMLDILFQGEKVCIASFEMKPVSTLKRMVRQVSGNECPTEKVARGFLNFCHGRLWLYDQQGMMDQSELLAVIRYSADKLGVKHFVVDSLMKCVRDEDSYNEQKAFVDALCSIARDFNIHIHLIHHSRKLGDEFSPPGKMDSKGSGSVADQVDQVLTVWRNKRKEAKRQANAKDYDENEFDARLICDKNRHGEFEGQIGLYFDPQGQFYGETRDWRRVYDLSDYEPKGVEI